MDNERDFEIDKYKTEFWSPIEEAFGLRLEGMSTSASPYLNGQISFNARFATKNRHLKNTSYYYNKNNKIIHFTSLSCLYSMINEGALRLYNLHNSNDPDEYSYASEKLKNVYLLQGYNEDIINTHMERIKEYSFILSSTSHSALQKKDFWEKYGDNGKGVAIEFEIMNSLDSWEYFYCSEVFYNKLEQFNKLKTKWEELIIKNNNINYFIGLDQFLGLHKSENWSHEEEIRILTLLPDLHEQPFRSRLYKDFKSRVPNKNIRYFKLPLCDKNDKFLEYDLENRIEFFWKLMPRLKMSDIFFGPDFPEKDKFWDFQLDLKYYVDEKLHCWLDKLPRLNLNDYQL